MLFLVGFFEHALTGNAIWLVAKLLELEAAHEFPRN
jgi:hypothetical protein